MARLSLLLIFLFSAAAIPEIFREYRLMQEGYASFERRAYPIAETKFRELLRLMPGGRESEAARFNLAGTLYMQGKYSQALPLFSHKTVRSDLLQKSRFNKANTLAMIALASKDKEQKALLLRNSLSRFRSVLLHDPADGDAKINYEIVRRYLEELEKPTPPTSSGQGTGSPARQSGVNSDAADRLLELAQQDESALMRQLPRQEKTGSSGKNDKDW
jgi:tetratricopeptide (TPR) repeat protein